ncbi:MAG: hypothetical protein AAGJ51_11225 [Pseudomonadota bacterium]
MVSKKRNFRADTIERNARRFPWAREEAQAVLQAIDEVVSATNAFASICRDLPYDDELDPDGWAVRSRRRMIRNAGECVAEVSDITRAIYSKYPDLAPEDLRGHYIA